MGIDAHVVTELGFPGDPGKDADRSCEVIDGIPYHRLGPGRAVPDRLDARLNTNAAELLDLVQYVRPAILHAASDYRNALLSLTVGAACGLPVIYEMRGFWEDTWRAGLGPSRQPGERYDLLRAREVACARSADWVVTLSDAMRRDLLTRGVDRERVTVVPNGVDVDTFRPGLRDSLLAERLAIAPEEVVVGYVSTLNPYEGLDCLLRALALAERRGLAIRGLIVGDGPDRDRLQALAADLRLTRTVHFTGTVRHDQVPGYYSLLDVFVVPRTDQRVSRLVPPLKPLEAMAMEKAVVVSGVDALQELVTDGVTGCVFTPGDPASLAAVLERLVLAPDLRRTLGRAAREFVVGSRTWSTLGGAYREIYSRVVHDRTPARQEVS